MLKNVGIADKVIRFAAALALFAAGVVLAPQGLWWIGLIALLPLSTGLLSYCPLWHVLGIKTISIKKL